jgi:hypothetical protein
VVVEKSGGKHRRGCGGGDRRHIGHWHSGSSGTIDLDFAIQEVAKRNFGLVVPGIAGEDPNEPNGGGGGGNDKQCDAQRLGEESGVDVAIDGELDEPEESGEGEHVESDAGAGILFGGEHGSTGESESDKGEEKRTEHLPAAGPVGDVENMQQKEQPERARSKVNRVCIHEQNRAVDLHAKSDAGTREQGEITRRRQRQQQRLHDESSPKGRR